MTPEEVRTLYAYNSWANGRTLDACVALTPEQLTRNLGSSFPSVRDTLLHIMGAEWIWLERWHGRSHSGLLASDESLDFPGIRARWPEIGRDLVTFISGLTPADLARILEYRNVRGNRFAYPLGSMLQHLVNHGTYHRGQITTMLRQLGAPAKATDYLRYFDALAGGPEE